MRWYERDPSAALTGMLGLTLEERGAYNTILDLLYARDGDLPDDLEILLRALGCDVRVWRRIKDKLISKGKIKIDNGFIKNSRVDIVVNRYKRKHTSAELPPNFRRTSAELPPNLSPNFDSESINNNRLEGTRAPATITITKKERKKEGGGVNAGACAEPSSDFKKIYQFITEKFPHLHAGNASPIKRWIEQGFDTELDIIAAIEQVHENGYDVGSIAYFTKPIIRLHQQRKEENHGERKASDRRSPAARAIEAGNKIIARRIAEAGRAESDGGVETDPGGGTRKLPGK